MTKKRSLDGGKSDKSGKSQSSQSQSQQEKIKKKKPKHETEEVWGQGTSPRSIIPPETVELLHKYFNLREIKAFAELYNALLLSKTSKNVRDITRKMVKDKMQSIHPLECKTLLNHEHCYAVNVTGISSDDVLHFLYWKYGCMPPDGIELHDALYYNFGEKLDPNPNKVKHNIFIFKTWLTNLENASRFVSRIKKFFPFWVH